MTLAELLAETGDGHNDVVLGVLDKQSVQVFGDDPRYYRLTDYVVSSAVSGPSLILIPRTKPMSWCGVPGCPCGGDPALDTEDE